MSPRPVARRIRPSADFIGSGGTISVQVINLSRSDEKCLLAPQSMMIGGSGGATGRAASSSAVMVITSATVVSAGVAVLAVESLPFFCHHP